VHLLVVDNASESSFTRPSLQFPASLTLHRIDDFESLESSLTSVSPPFDLAIFFLDRPKQLSQSTVLRCLALRPLMRLVVVLGPWCGGDLRTPGRLTGVFTMSFREAEMRLAPMLEEFSNGKGPWVKPLTTPDELIRPSFACRLEGKRLRVGVGLQGHLAHGLAYSIAILGHTPVLVDPTAADSEELDLVLIDGDQEGARPFLGDIKLCGFPRATHGFCLPKLFSLPELETALQIAHRNKPTAEALIR
jgi:hypothetical protein